MKTPSYESRKGKHSTLLLFILSWPGVLYHSLKFENVVWFNDLVLVSWGRGLKYRDWDYLYVHRISGDMKVAHYDFFMICHDQ